MTAYYYIWYAGRQVGTSLLIWLPTTTSGRQVGRLALLFSDCLLLHLVCRSAGWHFSSHMTAYYYIWYAGRQVGTSLLIWLPTTTSGRKVGRLALLFSSACLLVHLVGRLALLFSYGMQVGRLALLFSYDCLLLHLVGRSAGWHFSFHLPAFLYIW